MQCSASVRPVEAWCRVHGRCALPASPETVAAWASALATGADKPGAKPRSRNTVSQYVAAVVSAQKSAGVNFERDNPILRSTLVGISRTKARTETLREAQPDEA
jgi:hypothetical protein